MKNQQDNATWFRSVILGTDFSATDRIAGRYAALFAHHFNAKLIVAHAFNLQQPALEAEALGHAPSVQRERLQHQLSESLKELNSFGLQAEGVLGPGSPLELVQRLLQEHGPALLVLATHGGGAAERHIFMSVAEEILRVVQAPVLTVGPHMPLLPAGTLTFQHILIATDFSTAATHVAGYALALARHFGSKLDVLHVAPEHALREHHLLDNKQKQFLEALGRFDPDTTHAPLRSQIFLESGRVRERVLEHARENAVDLIVLGAHHHTPLAMHLRTGPAFQIILDATCPVLTIGASQ